MDRVAVEKDKSREWRLGWTLAAIFVMAVLFNYPWELVQSPLYIGMENFSAMWRHCFVASLGDGLLVLLIFATGWAALQQQDWFVHPGVCGYAVMLAAGLVVGVSVEWVAVYVVERRAYTPQMPLVPGLGIGIVPITQMLVLPPLIFRVAAAQGRPELGLVLAFSFGLGRGLPFLLVGIFAGAAMRLASVGSRRRAIEVASGCVLLLVAIYYARAFMALL